MSDLSDRSAGRFSIPSSWAWVRLADLQPEFQNGLASRGESTGSPTVVLRLADISNGRISLRSTRSLPVTDVSKSKYTATDADILVVRVNGSADLVGQFISCNVPEIVYCDHFIRMRIRGDLIGQRYLTLLGSSWFVRQQIERLFVSTAGQKTVNQGHIASITLPLPPRAEQERIVAAIEEQFSRLDAGVAALERVRLNLKRMRGQGISSLFDPLWPRVPLADVLTLISDCPHRTPTYTDSEEYPALRPRDVVGGELRLETSARVSAQEYRLQTARHTPEAGDIAYSRELSYGWAVELPEKPLLCLSQGMVILRTTQLLPGFLTLFLNSNEGRQQADRAATGTAHPHINLRDIKQYQVPFASHTDQRKVLARASELLSDCDRASQSVAAAMIRASTLRHAVLSYAFSGKLVPQDPDDEPAAVLLEKIAAERASSDGHRDVRTRKFRLLREDAST